jgi:hypothetical protein
VSDLQSMGRKSARARQNMELLPSISVKQRLQALPQAFSHGGGAGMKHISEQPPCLGDSLKLKTMQKGQIWKLEGSHELDQFGGNKHSDGNLDEVMAIALVYIRRKTAT